jgi:hypothetical protein
MGGRRFLTTWAAAAALFALTVAGFAVAVDPYLVFGAPRIVGFNHLKPTAPEHEQLAKVYQFARQRPRTIIFGSSRVDIGLDPNDPHWPAELRPVYNFGLAGIGMFGMRRYIEHALSQSSPTFIVVGLDFESFLSAPGQRGLSDPPMFEGERRMALRRDGTPNPDVAWQRAADYAGAAFSLSVLDDSVRTLLGSQMDSVDLTSSGDITEEGFRSTVRTDGQYQLFAQKNQDFFRQYSRPHLALFAGPGHTIPAMQDVRAILELCRAKGVRVILFLQPTHTDRLEAFELLDYWSDFEDWKRAMVALVSAFNGDRTEPPVALWDFSGYDEHSEEAIPAPGDRTTQLHWFWEPAHYTRNLGSLLLARIFGSFDDSFGVRLTQDTLGDDLASIRAGRNRFRATRPDVEKRLGELYRAVVSPRPAVLSANP